MKTKQTPKRAKSPRILTPLPWGITSREEVINSQLFEIGSCLDRGTKLLAEAEDHFACQLIEKDKEIKGLRYQVQQLNKQLVGKQRIIKHLVGILKTTDLDKIIEDTDEEDSDDDITEKETDREKKEEDGNVSAPDESADGWE